MGETVLVPVDGSPLSFRALRYALEKFPETDIVALHVSDIFEPGRGGIDSLYEPMIGSEQWYTREEETRESILADAEAVADEYDHSIETATEIGDPQRVIPDYAREEDIDHVVLGIHGREEEQRQMVGRVAETVVFRSPVTVTLVKP